MNKIMICLFISVIPFLLFSCKEEEKYSNQKAYYSHSIENRSALVLYDDTNVWDKPENGTVIGKINKNELVQVLEKTDKEYGLLNGKMHKYHSDIYKENNEFSWVHFHPWYRVVMKGNKTGWIFGQYLGININYGFNEKYFHEDVKKFNMKFFDILPDNSDERLWLIQCHPENEMDTVAAIIRLVVSSSTENKIIEDLKITHDEYIKDINIIRGRSLVSPMMVIEYFWQAETDIARGKNTYIYSYIDNQITRVFTGSTYVYNPHGKEWSTAELLIKFDSKGIPVIHQRRIGITGTFEENSEYPSMKYTVEIHKWYPSEKSFLLESKNTLPVIATVRKKGVKTRKDPADEKSIQSTSITRGDKLSVINVFNIQDDGYFKNNKGFWVQVKNDTGNYWIHSKDLDFQQDHAGHLLHSKDPLSKNYLKIETN